MLSLSKGGNTSKPSLRCYANATAGNDECSSHIDDTTFWWNSTGGILRTLLTNAGYSAQRIEETMFFYRQIVHRLGAQPTADGRPRKWRSLMTDDFSPIEFSWSWGNGEGNLQPKIRFSMEAIGHQAGTPLDPWNQHAGLDLVNEIESILPGTDLGCFGHISKLLMFDAECHVPNTCLHLQEHQSAMFLAFDFANRIPLLKAYIFPRTEASQTSQTLLTVVCNALDSLALSGMQWPAIPQLIDFLRTAGRDLRLEPFIISPDCVAPSEARLKIYVRSPDTSFASVEAIMSMFSDPHETAHALGELRRLWLLVLGLEDDDSPTRQLPDKAHWTSGMLYYLEVRADSLKISPKVYLPVKHYGRNDQEIAQGLATYLKKARKGQEQFVDNYLQSLREICSHRTLGSATGLQTYISCGTKNGSLDITSYLSPEIYHKGRWDVTL